MNRQAHRGAHRSRPRSHRQAGVSARFLFSAASRRGRPAERLSHSISWRLKVIDLGGKSLRGSCVDGEGETPHTKASAMRLAHAC